MARQNFPYRLKAKTAKRAVSATIILILVLTVLEFPAPIGFESRPQVGVSKLWLLLFFAIVLSESVAMIQIFKRPRFGALLAIGAGVLNLIQIIADLTHMMQPESAPWSYVALELSVGLLSLLLIYFSRQVLRSHA
ncbi:MAG: hypothetical protein WC800_07940 [Candidatus Nanopelagicaceae bacterium]